MGNSICAVSCGDREEPGTMRSQTEQGGDRKFFEVKSTVHRGSLGVGARDLEERENSSQQFSYS